MDHARGMALNITALVARAVPADDDGLGAGIGVHIPEPPDEWTELVAHYESGGVSDTRTRRLRVLVVADKSHQRGALALYVTSGWDIRFATDVQGATEALGGLNLDAIIAEYDLNDARWRAVLGAAHQLQPGARRVLRTSLHGRSPEFPEGLVQHTVGVEDGMEALVDALADGTR